MKSQIEMIITGEGLRVELLETEKVMFFESGRGEPTESGTELLARLAQELGKLPNKLLVEGHTDAKPYSVGGTYTNWELSSDRANAARRLMQQHGVRTDQIAQVRGFADQRLRTTKDPVNPSNRRVSVIVLYQDKQPAPAQPAGGHEAAKSGDGHAAPASTSHAPAQVPAASHHYPSSEPILH
jgi:chemotaxis protein MotB